MAKQQPSCIIEEIADDQPDPTQWDKVLGNVLGKQEGKVDDFLASVFGFLHRKTNFFKEGDAQERVLEGLRRVTGLSSGGKAKVTTPAATASSVPAAAEPAVSAAPAPAAPAAPPATPAAAASTLPAAISPSATKDAPTSSSPAAEAPASSSTPANASGKEAEPSELPDTADEEEGSKGLKPNSARGYDHGHYSWGQTLTELSVSVPVPKGTKAKMLDVVITRTKLKVAVKGQPAILEGELSEAVKAEDCMWNIEGSVVELTLTKQDGMHWWSAVLKGEPVIDVHKVEPENSKLGDLDAETRQTVEKMMFDQRQKAMGRPTSDEMKKDEMLKKFMAAHPEMDFSKAKMM